MEMTQTMTYRNSLATTGWRPLRGFFRAGCVLATLVAWTAGAHAADQPAIVATIKPLHGIVAAVTKGVAQPTLLLDGPQSPHSFTLKPSQAEALQNADFIFLVDPELEVPVGRIARSLPETVEMVPLIKAPGITTLKLRTGVAFERHRHKHGSNHDHGHDHEHKRGHAEAADAHDGHADHGKHGAHHDHDNAAKKAGALPDQDPHLWLDPENARAMAIHAAGLLKARFPEHAEAFTANLAAFEAQLDTLQSELKAKLKPAIGQSYLVFHDAYQYFERRFGLQAAGAISVSPEVKPGARRLSQLRKRVREANAVCVFAEPQFRAPVIDTVIEGSKARKGTVDPLGINVPPGPDFYPAFLRGLADSFLDCLAKA